MFTRFRLSVPVSIVVLSVVLFSFQKKAPPVPDAPHLPDVPAPPSAADTVPAPKAPAPPRVADFEDARRELKKAAAALEESAKNLRIPEPDINLAAINAQVEKAAQAIDAEQIKLQVAQSLKSAEAQKALAEADKVDVAAIQKEAQAAMKEAAQEIKAAQKELSRLQKEDFAQMKEELKNMKPNIEAELKTARAEMAKAAKELDEYEAFVAGLAADGLLNKTAYTVEHKDGKLYIDGKEQPEAVYNKYRSFLEKREKVKITKNSDGLNIRN